jgi:predicted site-specific integrase-resolvase
MKKLSTYASENSITYRTAWNRFKLGKIKGAYKDDTGHVLVPEASDNINLDPRVAIYTRVSSSENKDNLITQASRLEAYSIAKGYQILHIVKEVGSGVNDNRPKLLKLLEADDWNILLVEHKDRLARMGAGYINTLLKRQNRKLEIANQAADDTSDLVQDLVSVIYSFSARLYGLRRTKRNTEKIITCLNEIKDAKEKK